MDIKLGMQVASRDGVHLGRVDRLILEPDTNELFGVIVHKGHIFTQDRIVELGFVDSIHGDETVYLRVDAAEADALPRFAEHEFIAPTHEQLGTLPYPLEGGVSGGGAAVMPILWRTTYSGHGYRTPSRSFLEPAPVETGAYQVVSNLPDDALLISKGTDVVAKDGEKIGRVDDIVYAGDGSISGFHVRVGFLRHHDISVPAEMIDAITSEHIRLLVNADEVSTWTPPAESADAVSDDPGK